MSDQRRRNSLVPLSPRSDGYGGLLCPPYGISGEMATLPSALTFTVRFEDAGWSARPTISSLRPARTFSGSRSATSVARSSGVFFIGLTSLARARTQPGAPEPFQVNRGTGSDSGSLPAADLPYSPCPADAVRRSLAPLDN